MRSEKGAISAFQKYLTVWVMRNLLARPWRFNELKKDLEGISQKVLTDSLRSMEADGIITRTVYPEVPPRVEYALSELGESMRPIIMSMEAGESITKSRKNNKKQVCQMSRQTCFLLFSNHPEVLQSRPDCLFLLRRALWLLGILRFWQIIVLPHIQSTFSLHLRNIQGRNLHSTMLQHICLDLVICRSLLKARHIHVLQRKVHPYLLRVDFSLGK